MGDKFKLAKFLRVKDLLNSIRDKQIDISETAKAEIASITDKEQFLFVRFNVASTPKLTEFKQVKNNDLVGFVKNSLVENNISLKELSPQ